MNTDKFLIKEGSKLNLKNHATDFTGDYTDKAAAVKDLQTNIEKVRKLQDVLYAQDSQSLLLIFQAMDAAGKDGAIEHTMSGVNPMGFHVAAFKQPSDEELSHDFLWRCAKSLPERGKIGIFNRSHYEEVLIVRVHPQILAAQHLSDAIRNNKNIWKNRFEQIRNFEKNISENGTRIVKFFLNISKEEQKKRFVARIDEKEKNWKFSMGDVKERGHWNDYMKAYTEAISSTSTANSPWYVIPADRKWFTRLAVSEVVVQTLESMDLQYPAVSDAHLAELAEAKKLLEAER